MPMGPVLSQAELMRMMGPGPAPLARRSPLVLALWAMVTVAIIGAGVLAGFKIRGLRLDKGLRWPGAAPRRPKAHTAGLARGARLPGRDLRASPRAAYRAALARSEAVPAADFVDDVERARTAAAELGAGGGKDGALARAYSYRPSAASGIPRRPAPPPSRRAARTIRRSRWPWPGPRCRTGATRTPPTSPRSRSSAAAGRRR